MTKKEMDDMKAYQISEWIRQMGEKFRMYSKGRSFKPTKLNSNLTVVCTEVIPTGEWWYTLWDVLILKLSDLTFNK